MFSTRRQWLKDSTTAAGALAAAALAPFVHAGERARPRIVLRSSWQTVNIGDIAHTPGVLALLERHFPEADVRLWPSSVADGVREMLLRRFPKLEIVEGQAAIGRAMTECDFLLHGSGPSLVAAKDVARWVAETGKPFGVFGITWSPSDKSNQSPGDKLNRSPGDKNTPPPNTTPSLAQPLELLNQARFAYFRDSVSLEAARDARCTAPVLDFGPDGAFAVDLRNDDRAEQFLKTSQLSPEGYVCCIPRLRHTPYWKIKPNTKFDEAKHARNEAMKEHDHAPLRAAIERLVRETDLHVLLCPEDRSQMAVARELLFDPLPDAVRKRVVWREEYWLTDEALSVYRRSRGLFGLEMHSPIMCVGNGIPALVGRFAEQTSKGFMWRDIGLGDWLFDLDQPNDPPRIAETLLHLARDPAAAQAQTERARELVARRQREMIDTLRRTCA
jgi:polysaccharide pyruvyl transferase WcaK-like protein